MQEQFTSPLTCIQAWFWIKVIGMEQDILLQSKMFCVL